MANHDDDLDEQRPDLVGATEPLEAELERVRAMIIARRNRFVAAALAGLGMSGGCADSSAPAGPPSVQDGGRHDEDPDSGSGGTRSDAAATGNDAGDAAAVSDAASPDAATRDGGPIVVPDSGPSICLTPQ